MTFDDVKYTIKNHILNKLSYGDLSRLCDIFAIPLSDRRKNITKHLIDSITLTSDLSLLHNILCMLNSSEMDTNSSISANIQINQHNFQPNFTRFPSPSVYSTQNLSLNAKLYSLSEEVINKSPIDIRPELIDGVNPQNIFISNFTKYPQGYFNAPSCTPSLINGRMSVPNCQLPYVSKNLIIKPSPFYCCQVILHPTSLLIPKPTPNIIQTNRIMSKMPLNFILSTSVRQLIAKHCYQSNNKRFYKWQILLRFGVYDPEKPFPPNSEEIETFTEYIPPYLSISVNNIPVPLWEILPSNNINKEGKRHSRPVNISEYIKYNQVDEKGYRQVININWWQTPGLYLYYYVGVFLERKLDVNELLNQFKRRTHSVIRPISFTLDFIREKFSTNNQFNKIKDDDENDDDLIISSVLPVSLQCPVGKSRIECPLRSVNCQHLQCFDAHLYLMMNERRSVWKCPVCDGQANLNELFVDEYFQQILKDFESDESIIDVNVNPDGTYVPVAVKESREGKHNIFDIGKSSQVCGSNNNIPDHLTETLPVIFLESDDEDNKTIINLKQSIPPKVIEQIITNSPLKQAGRSSTIDLTSDSDGETKVDKTLDILVPQKTENIQPSFDSQDFQNASAQFQKSQNKISVPKLLPKILYNLPDKINFHPSIINENFSVAYNPFQRISNNRLLLPANKLQTTVPNMSWMPPNQSYSYIYPKESINKYIPQTFFTGQTFALHNKPSIQPTIVNQNKAFELANAINKINTQSKSNNFVTCTNGNSRCELSNTSSVQSSSSRSLHKKHKRKDRKQLPESRGFRRSSRIQRQDQKKYNESSDDNAGRSDSSGMEFNFKEKRKSHFNELDSSSSDHSNTKRKRLICDSSSEEELLDKSSSMEDISLNLKYPVICVAKLDQGFLNSLYGQEQVKDDAIPGPNHLASLSTDSL